MRGVNRSSKSSPNGGGGPAKLGEGQVRVAADALIVRLPLHPPLKKRAVPLPDSGRI